MATTTPPPGPSDAGTMPDKGQLYGKYQDHADARASIDVDRRTWQNKLHRELASKSLDIAMPDDDEMGDISVTKTVTNQGLGTKGLIAAALVGFPLAGLAAVASLAALQHFQEQTRPHVQPAAGGADPASPDCATAAESRPSGHIHRDTDTRIIPLIRFGPERSAER